MFQAFANWLAVTNDRNEVFETAYSETVFVVRKLKTPSKKK